MTGLLRRTVVLTSSALVLTSCTSDNNPTQPAARPVYTTPTGFVTATPPQIFIGAGDISSCSNNGDEMTAEIIDTIPGAVYNLGDDAYDNGSTSEFANCYDPTWGRFKNRTKPSAGNHEYNTSGAAPYFAYFGAAAGEPGKGYYSYDLGAWHIIVLNSNITRSAGSPQDTWLKADLAAHPNRCTLAYWHHPLYSSTGGSGSGGTSITSMRPFWDALYAAQADLVLNGHRHFYERMAPMKPDGTSDDAHGIRTIIAGTGGIGGGTVTNMFPTSQVSNGDTRGVLKLYLYDDSYAWRFIPIAGKTFTDTGSTACHSSAGGGGGGGGGVSASQSGVTASPTSVTTGVASTITVTVKDGNGNPISGATVVLSATGSGNTLTQPSSTTNGSGVATGSLSSTVAEGKTVSAMANGTAITQTASVAVTSSSGGGGGGGGAGTVTQTLLTAGSSATNAKVYTTASIAPAPNALVTVAVRSRRSSGPLTPALSGGGMTDWTPVATLDYDAVSAPDARVAVFRALNAAPGSAPLTIAFSSSVSNVEWTVSQWTGVDASGVNGAGAIGQIGSARGDNVSGLSVPLAAFANANNVAYGVLGARLNAPAVTPGAGFTEIAEPSSGESTLLETEWATDLSTIQAGLSKAANAGLLGIEINAGSSGPTVSAALSTVTASPTSFAAGGNATITVTVKDGNGNPMSGVTVSLAASGGGNTITQPAATTDANGVATGTLSSTTAGSKTITATAAGVTLTQQPVVSVGAGPPDGAQSSLSASPTSIVAGSGSSAITVTVRDAYGNPVSGATVTLAASGTGNTLGQPGPTDATGVTTGTLSSTDVQTETVSATAGGVAIAQTASVAVTSQPPAGIAQTLLTSGHDVNNQRIYTTAAIAPAPNALVTVAVLTHQATSAAPSPTVTGGGMTEWTPVATIAYNGATPLDRLTIYRAMSPAPGSGPITITSSVTVSNCQWIVSQWSGVDQSGSNGSGAIVQTASASGSAVSTLTAALAPFASAADVAYGAFGVASNTAVVTAGPGFTAIDQQPSGESSIGDLFAEWGVNLPAVTADWPSKSAGALGVEIRAAP